MRIITAVKTRSNHYQTVADVGRREAMANHADGGLGDGLCVLGERLDDLALADDKEIVTERGGVREHDGAVGVPPELKGGLYYLVLLYVSERSVCDLAVVVKVTRMSFPDHFLAGERGPPLNKGVAVVLTSKERCEAVLLQPLAPLQVAVGSRLTTSSASAPARDLPRSPGDI
jgi:hypothetical protein